MSLLPAAHPTSLPVASMNAPVQTEATRRALCDRLRTHSTNTGSAAAASMPRTTRDDQRIHLRINRGERSHRESQSSRRGLHVLAVFAPQLESHKEEHRRPRAT